MADKNIKVTPDELIKAAEKVSQMADNYRNLYERLYGVVDGMTAGWDAADNVAFVEQINGFREEFKAMAEHLTTSSETLKQQAGNYNTTVETNVQQAKKLPN